MRKYLYLLIGLFSMILLIGCEKKLESSYLENTNIEPTKEITTKNSKVICKGKIDKKIFESIDDVITSNSIKVVAEYNTEEKLQSITYIYEVDFATQVKGDKLDNLNKSLKEICEDKKFSSCTSDISQQRAIVEAEVDITHKKYKDYSKEKFKNEMKTIGEDFHCIEE